MSTTTSEWSANEDSTNTPIRILAGVTAVLVVLGGAVGFLADGELSALGFGALGLGSTTLVGLMFFWGWRHERRFAGDWHSARLEQADATSRAAARAAASGPAAPTRNSPRNSSGAVSRFLASGESE